MAAKRKTKTQREPNPPEKKSRSRRPGCLTVTMGLLLIAALLVFIAPMVVSRGPLLELLVARALPEFKGRLAIGSASLNWFSPVRIHGINVVDPSGSELVSVKSIQSEKPLYALVTNYRQLGHLRVVEPHLRIELRDDGSNWEDLLDSWSGSSSGQADRIALSVAVVHGAAEIHDVATTTTWNVEEANVTVNVPQADPIEAKVVSSLRSQTTEPGRLEADISWKTSADVSDMLGEGQLSLKSHRIPLKMLQPLLRRLTRGAELDGIVSSSVELEWSSKESRQTARVHDLTVSNLDVAAPEFIGSDRLQLPLLNAAGELGLDQQRIHVNALTLESDVIKLEATGVVDRNRLSGELPGTQLISQDYRIVGEADLAVLAGMFPQTLRIRQGTQITAGQIALALNSHQVADERRWTGNVDASHLEASSNGRLVRWEQPIQVAVSAVQSTKGVQVERLECSSSFLVLSGAATREKGSFSATVDLDRLAAELTQFVDLRDIEIAGKLEGKLDWQSAANNKINAQADATVTNFALSTPQGRPWREQQMLITGSAAFADKAQESRRIAGADVQISSGSDKLIAALTEPVALDGQVAYPLKWTVTGKIATWLPRLQAWVQLPGWEVDGQLNLVAAGTVNSEKIEIASSQTSIKQFRAAGGGLMIEEPEIQSEAALQWNWKQRTLATKSITMTSSAVSARTDNLAVDLLDSGLRLNGDIAFRGDLGRVTSWTYDAHTPPRTHLFGMTSGLVHVSRQSGKTQIKGSADVEQLIVARRQEGKGAAIVSASAHPTPWQTIWSENRVRMQGDASMEDSTGKIDVANFDVATDGIRVAAKGKASDLGGICNLDLNGQVSYDWQALSPRLVPYVGRGVQLSGRDSREFRIQGPLKLSPGKRRPSKLVASSQNDSAVASSAALPDDFAGQASLGWTSIQAHGFVIGEGELEGNLSGGLLRFQPLDLAASEGRIKLFPSINLSSEPAALVLGQGTAAERLRISPEMCRSWFKYLAPLLADATRAEGELSVDIAECRVPILEASSGDLRANVRIHHAQIGAGAAGQQLISLADQVISIFRQSPTGLSGGTGGWVSIPEQSVAMRMTQRRVYHENLQLVVGDVTIKTSGSVGVDQTIRLDAEIPIRDEWVASARYLAGLQGQVVKIPIEGTLSKPKVDNGVLANLTKQALGGSVEKLLQDELIKGLESLFGPNR